jgi:hypothetical protein
MTTRLVKIKGKVKYMPAPSIAKKANGDTGSIGSGLIKSATTKYDRKIVKMTSPNVNCLRNFK